MKISNDLCPICKKVPSECSCKTEHDYSCDPEISEFLDNFSEMNDKAIYPIGFENAVIGSVERFGMAPLILLDRDECIRIFMDRDGMDYEEAIEFFDFNVIGAWMGEGTPCFATLIKKD